MMRNPFLAAAIALSAIARASSAAEMLRFDFSPSPLLAVLERQSGARQTLACPRCTERPKIDGRLDDAAWRGAALIESFGITRPVTRARLCFDDAALYIGVECSRSPDRPPQAREVSRDGNIWRDDVIEVWIDPRRRDALNYQFAINAIGSFFDQVRKGAGGDEGYNPDWEHAVSQEKARWTVEMAIPPAAIEQERWHQQVGFNIGRNGPGLSPHSWSSSYGDTSSSFLVLQGAPEAAAEAEAGPALLLGQRFIRHTGDSLRVAIEKPVARPGDRWLEVSLHVSPTRAALGKTRILARLYGPASTRPLTEAAHTPERPRGTLWVDLRRTGLDEARLSVELFEEERCTGTAEAFLSASRPDAELSPQQKIPVNLDLPDGIDSVESWPVTFGVPFPAGALWDVQSLRLVDAQGRELPSQKEATGTWAREGSVKWVRFDALVSPKDGCFVELSPATGPPPQKPVRLIEQGDRIVLETGPARYVLSKGASPIEEVWRGEKRVATVAGTRGLYVVDQQGRSASASADDETMQIEARGPVAACVRFEGFYRTSKGEPLARHITRIEAFAGQPFAKVTHTLVLTCDTNEVWFKDIGWEFAVEPGAEPKAVFGVSREEWQKSMAQLLDEATPTAYMLQDQHYRFAHGDDHFVVAKLGAEGKPATAMEGQECGDWAVLVGQRAGLGVSCKEAARQHPKQFEMRRDRVVLHLFSSRAGEELDFRAPALVERWDLATWYKNSLPHRDRKRSGSLAKKVSTYSSNAVGWAKTHELLVAPVSPAEPAAATARLSRLHTHPVFALAAPDWIYKTEVMGSLHPRDPERFPLAEKLIEGTFRVWERRMGEWGDYGFVDYFASPHLGYAGKYARPYRYCLFTYTLRADLWLAYARSGDRRIREFAAATNRAYLDNVCAHWDGNGKVRGLFVIGGGTGVPDGKGSLPFYWEGNPSMACSSSSNLDNFILDYHLTGYRRAREHVLEYADGMKRFWTPAKARTAWRGLMVMRLLAQAYAFTWDLELRALAEATTDTFADPEGEIGLSKERPYRSSTYKTQVDIAGLLDAWQIFGTRRYYDLSMKVSQFWWRNNLGGWPIFYCNPQGRIGNFLYRETGDPSYAQALAIQLRQAATRYDSESGEVIGGLRPGQLGAEDSTFVFQGIPYAQDLIVRSGADRAPAASWVGYEDFGYAATIVAHKADDEALEIDLKTASEGASAAGGVRLKPVQAGTTSGLNLSVVRGHSNATVSIRVPKDAPASGYEIIPDKEGTHFALVHSKAPLVVHAPEFWRPSPRQAPPVKWYFRLPDESEDAQIFFEGRAKLLDPEGRPWPDSRPVTGWTDLPPDRPGLWSFQLVLNGLVRVRNVPPFFAAEAPESHFTPKIQWTREPIPAPQKKIAPDTVYVPGAVGTRGNQALYLTGRRAFVLDAAGALPSGDANEMLPFEQGTIEFYFKPRWSTFDLPDPATKHLVRMGSTGEAWSLRYMKDLKAGQWLSSHVLYGYFMSDGPRGRISMRAYRRTVLARDEWVHVAWVWGAREMASFKTGSRQAILTARIFVDGKAGQQYSYRWDGHLPADQPTVLHLGSGIEATYDELRISGVRRYTQDFRPPSRDRELALDEHTRALFHFNGSLKGEAFGADKPLKATLRR